MTLPAKAGTHIETIHTELRHWAQMGIAKTKETGKGAARLRRGPSAAQSLAKERQWTGPLPGEEIDYYDGSPKADDEEKAATG